MYDFVERVMARPIIGITSHTVPGTVARSGVVQLYVEALVEVGAAPLAVPVGLDPDGLHAVYDRLDGLLVPGGSDVAPERYHAERHPKLGVLDEERDEMELILTTWGLADDMPILGICRGIQVLAVAGGGSLYQDLPTEWTSEVAHDVREYGWDHLSHALSVERGSVLAGAVGSTELRVNSLHHQAVRDLPADFLVSARSEDGIIEGIEAVGKRFVVGVQCHPEGLWRTTAPEFRGLFAAFVEAAREFGRARAISAVRPA